jgi:hypothetical protein
MVKAFTMIGLALGIGALAAQASAEPTATSFEAPRDAVVMADDIAATGWPTRLAKPSAEGQFEVLLRKTATTIKAPACDSPFLVVRMPASVSIKPDPAVQEAVARKRQTYERMLDAYQHGKPMRFDVFAGPYGKRTPGGGIVLTGCNLFFTEPDAARH